MEEGKMQGKIKILFLCTGNSSRSQMAEAWTNKLKSEKIEAFSAGVSPRPVDPRTIKVMAEVGIDISRARSKDVSEFKGTAFDYVITLCGDAQESCPLFPGSVRKLHKGFEDPVRLAVASQTEEEAMAHYRRIGEGIREFVAGMPGNLTIEG